MDKKGFWEAHVPQKTKTYISWGVMAGFIYTVVIFMSMLEVVLAFIPALIILGLTLGILLGRSRVCAVVLLAYYVLAETVAAYFIAMGIIEWLMVIVFSACYVCGMLGTFEFQRYWRDYQKTGALPPKQEKKA